MQEKPGVTQPIQDRLEVLRLLEPQYRRRAYLLTPDSVRVDTYEDGILMEYRVYEVDPLVMAQLFFDQAVEHKVVLRTPDEPHNLGSSRWVISAMGHKMLAKAKPKAA